MVPFSHTLALAKSIAHAIFWGAEGLGEGYVKITLRESSFNMTRGRV